MHRTRLDPNSPHQYHDLDELAGSWSKEEAKAFDRALAKQRGIDLEMWT